jgi:hypothetical protein
VSSHPRTSTRPPDARCAWCGLKLTADAQRPVRRDEQWYHTTCTQ